MLEFKTQLDKLWKNSRYDLSEVYLFNLCIAITGSDDKKKRAEWKSKPLGLNNFPNDYKLDYK